MHGELGPAAYEEVHALWKRFYPGRISAKHFFEEVAGWVGFRRTLTKLMPACIRYLPPARFVELLHECARRQRRADRASAALVQQTRAELSPSSART